ncbi:MAG: HPr kinase/phosphatase C-terminal domain-containing protein [Rhodospirillales bacterium]|nr:HPr kinase/phosphatase C-terminal domain-containing protein [Rhodospirillales bacterium]
MERLRGTCVAIDGAGVLLRGPSGSGKSDLALRLIDVGACLVSDDYTCAEAAGGAVTASAPEALAGLLEVRGIGVLRMPAKASVRLDLVIDLVDGDSVERMPAPDSVEILGVRLPYYRLTALEPSSASKVRAVVGLVCGRIVSVE